MKDWKKEIFTIPNMLSMIRLLMIPVYMTIYLHAQTTDDFVLAAAILTLSCLTDLIDGKIARRFHMTSIVGQVLDPIADKATQLSLLVCMAIEYPIVWTLLMLFALKEGYQLIAMLLAYRKGKILKGALLSGKICTTVLFTSLIGMVMFHDYLHQTIVSVVTIVNTIFMVISFAHYAYTYKNNTSMIRDLNES